MIFILMYIHNLNPVLFNFGFFEIRWYSLAYIFGILIGWILGKKLIKLKNVLFILVYGMLLELGPSIGHLA